MHQLKRLGTFFFSLLHFLSDEFSRVHSRSFPWWALISLYSAAHLTFWLWLDWAPEENSQGTDLLELCNFLFLLSFTLILRALRAFPWSKEEIISINEQLRKCLWPLSFHIPTSQGVLPCGSCSFSDIFYNSKLDQSIILQQSLAKILGLE